MDSHGHWRGEVTERGEYELQDVGESGLLLAPAHVDLDADAPVIEVTMRLFTQSCAP